MFRRVVALSTSFLKAWQIQPEILIKEIDLLVTYRSTI